MRPQRQNNEGKITEQIQLKTKALVIRTLQKQKSNNELLRIYKMNEFSRKIRPGIFLDAFPTRGAPNSAKVTTCQGKSGLQYPIPIRASTPIRLVDMQFSQKLNLNETKRYSFSFSPLGEPVHFGQVSLTPRVNRENSQ
jgi:phosphorylcholine metabolism protein LicD